MTTNSLLRARIKKLVPVVAGLSLMTLGLASCGESGTVVALESQSSGGQTPAAAVSKPQATATAAGTSAATSTTTASPTQAAGSASPTAPATATASAAATTQTGATAQPTTPPATPTPTPPPAPQPTTVLVDMKDSVFLPATVSISAGQTVTVVEKNDGAELHNWHVTGVKDDSGKVITTPLIATGAQAQVTFTVSQPGTYKIVCDVHVKEMTGSLVVGG